MTAAGITLSHSGKKSSTNSQILQHDVGTLPQFDLDAIGHLRALCGL
jgi:hypothetical protein